MSLDELLKDLKKEFKRRKFAAGLLIAIIDLVRALDALGGRFPDFKAFLKKYPRQVTTSTGGRANTLIGRR